MQSGARPLFTSIAIAVVPECMNMSEAEWDEFFSIIDSALARRPPRVRRQLSVFLRLINLRSRLLYSKPLTRLSNQQRKELLTRFEDSPLLLFRRGFWGIRTLVFMGYYARKGCSQQLGYAAAARGWELRR